MSSSTSTTSSCRHHQSKTISNNSKKQDSRPHSETKDTTEVAAYTTSRAVNRGSSKQDDRDTASEVPPPPRRQHTHSPPRKDDSNGRWFLPFGHITTSPSPILPQFRANTPVGPTHNFHQNGPPPFYYYHPSFPSRRFLAAATTTMAPFDNNNSITSIDTTIHDLVDRPDCAAFPPPSSNDDTALPQHSHRKKKNDIYHKVSYDEEATATATSTARRPSPVNLFRRQYSYNSSYPSPVYTLMYEPFPYDHAPLTTTAGNEEEMMIASSSSVPSTPPTSNQTSSKTAAAKAAAAAQMWQQQHHQQQQHQSNGEYSYYHDDRPQQRHASQYYQGYYYYHDEGSPRGPAPSGFYNWDEPRHHHPPPRPTPPQTHYYHDRRDNYQGHSSNGFFHTPGTASWGYLPPITTTSESYDDFDDHRHIPAPPSNSTTPYSPKMRSAPTKVTPSTGTSIRRKPSSHGGQEQQDHNKDATTVKSVLKSSSPNTPFTNQASSSSNVSNETAKAAGPTDHTSKIVSNFTSALGDMDIVVGRGAPTNYHVGNEAFRELVTEFHTAYFCAKRSDKPLIAMQVLDVLKERGSRFVRRQKGGGRSAVWVEVNQKLAYEKVCAALRDGAPQVQRQMLSSAAKFQEESSVGEYECRKDACFSNETPLYPEHTSRANLFCRDSIN